MIKVTSSVAEKRLGDAPAEKRFLCHDGRVLKNMLELEGDLRDMKDETFRYHANEGKNDFSRWIADVIGDEKLSRDMLKSATSSQAARSVASRIAWLKGKTAVQ